MNSSFPSTGNDGCPPGLPGTNNGGLGTSTGTHSLPSTSFPSQASAPPPPSLAQLKHSNHHTNTLHHTLHGGHVNTQHNPHHTSSILHASGPSSLPPPPLTSSLGGPNAGAGRSSHHHLAGSILHMGEGPGSILSNTGGSYATASNHSIPSSSTVSGLINHPVRLTSTNSGTAAGSNQNLENNEMNASSSAQYGMCGPSSTSPRRNRHEGASQPPLNQQFAMNRSMNKDATGTQFEYYNLTAPMNNTSSSPPPISQHQQASNPSTSMNSVDNSRRELRVEDALLYLDQVKQQFNHKPDIYNQFLDVMKDFKAQAINTPGVIMRVSKLFRGYPSLILGFNTFLPPGYRIRPDGSLAAAPEGVRLDQLDHPAPNMSSSAPSYQQPTQMNSYGATVGANSSTGPNNAPCTGVSKQGSHSRYPITGKQSSFPQGNESVSHARAWSKSIDVDGAAMTQSLSSLGNTHIATGNLHGSTNPVEFDHAIHYVTTIKQRFADEPETYKEFLAILHTYQREQRSIRQVLDQVSYLFRDHPDLLREFTFFLPDAVQEQAKERLDLAAEKALQRKDQMNRPKKSHGRGDRSGNQAFMNSSHLSVSSSAGRGQGDSHMNPSLLNSPSSTSVKGYRNFNEGSDATEYGDAMHSPSYEERGGEGSERNERDYERDRTKAMYALRRSKRRPYNTKERRAKLATHDVVVDQDEWHLFERIKRILPSRENWREFLKCLELYSQEVLDRNEMLSLVKNLFGRHTDLVQEFDRMLCLHGELNYPTEMWPFIPLAETDLSQCRRATPSYRGLPASYPIPPCSYRSELEESICNDLWVSVPTGSEDFSFKNMRKNQYEEALFKCEDERFEIDMIIDCNTSTINVLEPLARELEILKEEPDTENKLWNCVIDRNLFRVTHLNAISRIYGEAGTQILEMLRKYPAGTIPIILKRLKQKDEEWRRVRQDMNKQWKEVNEKNYHKSLDHSSFYFKQKDKNQTSSKVLLSEAKKKLEASQERTKQVAADSVEKEGEIQQAERESDEQGVAETMIKSEASLEDDMKDGNNESKCDIKVKITSPTSLENPPPVRTSTAHFQYKFTNVQIHRDAYGLLSYAAEKTLGYSTDKEKVAKVWQSFFFPFFRLQKEWLVQKPQQTKTTLEKKKIVRPETEVTSDFGNGIIQYYDPCTSVYVVNLSVGQGYLQPSAITIQESSDFPPDLPVSDDSEKSINAEKYATTLIGDQHAYLFLRLYQILHHRLECAYELCEKAKRYRYRRTINPAARALAHSRHSLQETAAKDETVGDYQAFLSKLYGVIGGTVDSTKYEDCCRGLMGSTSYFLFTMDKLVALVLKQMQQLAIDETSVELLKLFSDQCAAKSADSSQYDYQTYLNKTKPILEGDSTFRLEYQPGILRQTPLDFNPSIPGKVGMGSIFKIWAPSPRIRQPEANQWLVEPRLVMEHLGSLDEDHDGDVDMPCSGTPTETLTATPLFESSCRDSNEDGETDSMDIRAGMAGGESSGDETNNLSTSEEAEAGENVQESVEDTVLGKRPRDIQSEEGSEERDGLGLTCEDSVAVKDSGSEEVVQFGEGQEVQNGNVAE
uniref:Paired amphipathic helix protein Sin3 putative n=1 Tax=Albugo laibachii Nc14 TaxID=890382 RepID=F0WKD5_9STRA|nr:paired amphipathic helix protein Sin3 putative [Albugo laibachii Nc14]|eukprot:CCA21739.1 paired amphipathic helix protein Sin3 putative [Albugo laibachii Nc14]